VNTLNVKGKVKRTMRGLSRRKNWKKAVVRLADGQTDRLRAGRLRRMRRCRCQSQTHVARSPLRRLRSSRRRICTRVRRTSRCSRSSRGPVAATTPAVSRRGTVGGGHKQHYRLIDFVATRRAFRPSSSASSTTPNRSAHIALRQVQVDGERRYILAPRACPPATRSALGRAMRRSSRAAALPLRNIPARTIMHNIELKPGKGGQIARSAGVSAQLVAREGAPTPRCV
jgi:hypothetical protein